MKACIYQKQEPVNIPQIETSILTDVLACRLGLRDLRPAHALEPRCAPPPLRAALQRQERARGGPRPRGLHPRALPQRGLRRRGRRRPQDRAAAAAPPRAAHGALPTQYVELDERVLLGFGGVSEYGITVRWDKNFLTLVYLSLARRTPRRSTAACASAAPSTSTTRGSSASTTSPSPRARASPPWSTSPTGSSGHPSGLGLPHGPAAHRGLQAQLAGQPPGAPARGRHRRRAHGHRHATELRAYYVVQVEKALERHETLCRELGEAAATRGYTAEERRCSTSSSRTAGPFATSDARAACGGPRAALQRAAGRVGRRDARVPPRLNESPAYRLNHEEVEKFLEEGVRFIEHLSPKEAVRRPVRRGEGDALRPHGR
jgi:hypothetical protein